MATSRPDPPCGDEADLLGSVLRALADPTRRAVFELVAHAGPVTATTLAAELPVSRQAIAKHLAVLADAALVASDRLGRETRWTADPAPLDAARVWFEQIDRSWDRRLTALADRIQERNRATRSDIPVATDCNGE